MIEDNNGYPVAAQGSGGAYCFPDAPNFAYASHCSVPEMTACSIDESTQTRHIVRAL